MARIFYVYGVVPATAATSGAPGGMDDSPVGPIVEGQLAALASELPGDTYDAVVRRHAQRRRRVGRLARDRA